MKKLLLFVAVMLIGFTVNAQSDKGDFTLAPQVGLNLSTYSSVADYNVRTSFSAGIIAEYYFSQAWSFRSGLIYDGMGAEDGFNNTDKLNYMTLPLNANWHFGKKRNWYLNFGASISFLVGAESELSDGTIVNIENFVPSTDFGLNLGIGYKFNIDENTQLYIDYQGLGGFIDVDDTNSLPFEIRNSRSSFNVGVVFNL